MQSFKNICTDSLLEKEYIQYLKNENIKVISFDIFETLTFRKVRQATDLFNSLAKHKFVKEIFFTKENFVLSRVEAEKKARELNSKNEDVTLKLIYKQLPLNKGQRKKIIKLELEEEYKSLYINSQIKRWIKLAYKYNKKIILTSDTYFSSKELEYLVLQKLNKEHLISELYVSNEQNKTKATGNLYLKILQELEIDASQLLHIGDNIYSDVEMAKQKGIKSIHYSSSPHIHKLFDIETKYIPSLKKNHNYRVQASLLNPYSSKEEKFFFDLGAVVFGAILWEFSHWTINLAKKNSISQINYIMREGRIFQKSISQLQTKMITQLIYASRKSTFLPSIEIDEIKKNGLNFSGYRNLNMYDLFGLKDTKTPLKEQLPKIKKNIYKEKELFKKYLKQLDYKHKSLLIDFGGTGSILKNMQRSTSIHNQQLYSLFYMHSSGVKKMQGCKIFSFLPLNSKTEKEIELIRRNHEFIEILFNGNHKTTLNYQENSTKVVPITASSKSSSNKNRDKLKAFDKGINAFFNVCKKYKLKDSLYSRENLLLMLTRLIEVPTKDEAIELGNLHHDESYKNSSTKKIITNKDKKIIQKIGIGNSFYSNNSNLAFLSGKVSWVNGAITQLDDKYIQNIKSLATKGANSNSITKILEVLDENRSITEIYLYGSGELFKELLPSLIKRKIKIKSLIDARAKIADFSIEGYKVTSLDKIALKDEDCIVVASVVFATEITNNIIKYAQKRKIKIVNFHDGLVRIN